VSIEPTVREIVQLGDPALRRPARPLTAAEIASPALATLIADMRATMRAAPGVGLAAPQIGLGLQLAVIEDPPDLVAQIPDADRAARERSAVPFHVVINPTLTVLGDEVVEAYEGCLSFAGFVMVVARARRVRVEALDEHGQPFVRDATGWYARILQHECDHLRGVVCCDRMDARTLACSSNHARFWKGRSIEEVRAALAVPVGPDEPG
jgi:peptide deformylase